tara:strand:+ start:6024 stop:6233 length:210 start_codon:yes stop_codon:yes gene_type:complete
MINGLPEGYEVVEVSDGTGGHEYIIQSAEELHWDKVAVELEKTITEFLTSDMAADLEAQDFEVFGEGKI